MNSTIRRLAEDQDGLADEVQRPGASIASRGVAADLLPKTVWVIFASGNGEPLQKFERAVTEIRDHFVFTDTGGPFCLDDGAWCCHIDSGVRLHDDSLAACKLALRTDKERRRKLGGIDT